MIDGLDARGRFVNLHTPAYIVHSTHWSAEPSGWVTLGHFRKYRIGDRLVDAEKCRGPYEDFLCSLGYELIGKGWNGAPTLYRRVDRSKP